MKLDDLLDGDEGQVAEWLGEKSLLHECNCGYTVYSPDAVSETVQETWGDDRSEEIDSWAGGLADCFGWMFIESSYPKHDIYHCQHCAESELSLLSDLERISRDASDSGEPQPAPKEEAPGEAYVVYVDESYTDQFPRKPDGSLSFAAFVIPESAVEKVRAGVESIICNCYPGSRPLELKYSKISKHPGLLERVGRAVADLIKSIPESAVLAIYVPRSGLFGEQQRALRAVGHYSRQPPPPEALQAIKAPAAVEAAVRETISRLAQTIAGCVGSYLGSRNLSGRIVFDPRNRKADESLAAELEKILPKTPINLPLFRHGDAIVSAPPSSKSETLGDRVKIEFSGSSHQTHGLQIADFIAGDVRTFFGEVPELLTDATDDELLVNKRVLFPQFFHRSKLSETASAKLDAQRTSALPLYRDKLANGLISCYAINGQMRNIDLQQGSILDIMD